MPVGLRHSGGLSQTLKSCTNVSQYESITLGFLDNIENSFVKKMGSGLGFAKILLTLKKTL